MITLTSRQILKYAKNTLMFTYREVVALSEILRHFDTRSFKACTSDIVPDCSFPIRRTQLRRDQTGRDEMSTLFTDDATNSLPFFRVGARRSDFVVDPDREPTRIGRCSVDVSLERDRAVSTDAVWHFHPHPRQH